MLTTKQFADLCSTTKKTIIHYDRINLLRPASYNKSLHTTFRLYEPKQVLVYQKIYMLKSFGLSLAKIKESVNDKKCFEKVFKERKEFLSREKMKLETKLKRLSEHVNSLENGKSLVSPKIKNVKPYYIYAIERTGRYIDIKRFDKELSELINDPNFKYSYVTIFKKQIFSPDRDDMIIGAVVGNKKPKEIKDVTILKMEGYKTLSYIHIGSYSFLSFIWQSLDKYVQDYNLKRDPKNPVREFYIRGGLIEPNEDNLITELQIPILHKL